MSSVYIVKGFNDEFQHILRSITLENKFACVLGDYNVNTYGKSEQNNIHIVEFSNQFMLNGFTKLITKPTRIFHNKKSLLNLFYKSKHDPSVENIDNYNKYRNLLLQVLLDMLNEFSTANNFNCVKMT